MIARIAAAVLLCGSALAADLGPDVLLAARKGQTASVAAMLAKGAPLEARDKNGRTPLMLAARYGQTAVVKLLLEKGADPAARDREGWTAYALAITNSHDDVVRALPPLPQIHLVVETRWVPENLYSSCLMSVPQLAQHVAEVQPDMIVLGAIQQVASLAVRGLVEIATEGAGDGTLNTKVRPGASCLVQQNADNLSLAVDIRLVRTRDERTLLEKTFGGGLKGLHARSATSPAQYGALYGEWARNHATSIYWAALEAWLRAP